MEIEDRQPSCTDAVPAPEPPAPRTLQQQIRDFPKDRLTVEVEPPGRCAADAFLVIFYVACIGALCLLVGSQ